MERLKILVVEDSETHHRDAVRILAGEMGIHLALARNETDGRQRMEEGGVDGVITDLFMPHSSTLDGDSGRQPCGIAVMLEAQKLGIPCVLCVAGHRHGPRYEWIWSMGHRLGWPEIVDCKELSNVNGEAGVKNWQYALTRLTALMK